MLGRVATGPRAGQRVLRLGNDPTAPVVITGGPRHAHLEGLDLHAATAVRADERERLERLCRYVLRPPVAQDALELTGDGKVLLHLRRPWRDGTRAICFEPVEFLEKLCVLVPCPRTHLLIYRGALSPEAIAYINEGNIMNSSLQLYAPLNDPIVMEGSRLMNLAPTSSYLLVTSKDCRK